MVDVVEYMKDLASMLEGLGTTQLVYATAELAPYSSQFKPDVVFSPASGGYRGQIFFVDYLPGSKFPSRSIVKKISDRRNFVEEYIERSITRYFAVFESEIDEFSKKVLKRGNILVLEYPLSCALLFERIRSIVSQA